MLIRLRPGTPVFVPAPGQESLHYGDYYAYSKICTHLGCPASLYESQTNRILCPCHQSQFIATEYARPVFGPAARPLPQLPITVNDEGYLVATGDFDGPVGPAFWEHGEDIERDHHADLRRGGTGPVGTALDELDQRYHPAAGLRRQFNKVFPTHWSFMLGEVALYSFIVLLLSGIYLGLFFDPSMAEVVYDGPFDNLRGVHDVAGVRERAGHLVRGPRRAVRPADPPLGGAAVRRGDGAHMMRMFFTGAFRKPREANWVLGVLLIFLGTFEGFPGYSLPDDLLSGTGLRIASGITLSVPVIGHLDALGGVRRRVPGHRDHPAALHHPRAAAARHPARADRRCTSGWCGTRSTPSSRAPAAPRSNVVGVRILPVFAAKGGAFFAVCVGIIAMMGGLFQINPIWNLGPYNPVTGLRRGRSPTSTWASSDGMARMFPAWEIVFGQLPDPRGVLADGGVPAAAFIVAGDLPGDRAEDDQATTRCTTCCSARGTSRCGPRSGSWRSRSTSGCA